MPGCVVTTMALLDQANTQALGGGFGFQHLS